MILLYRSAAPFLALAQDNEHWFLSGIYRSAALTVPIRVNRFYRHSTAPHETGPLGARSPARVGRPVSHPKPESAPDHVIDVHG